MSIAFSQGELDVQTTVAGTVETVISQALSPKHLQVVITASIVNVDADWVELAWKDSSGTYYRLKRVTGAGSWSQSGMAQIPPVLGVDLVARISDSAGASSGTVMCDGSIEVDYTS